MEYQPYPNHAYAWVREKVYEVNEIHTNYLSTLTTRQLMRFMEYARASGYHEPIRGMKCTEAEIKFVLDKREHVPNKIEARKIRQEKAKKGINLCGL